MVLGNIISESMRIIRHDGFEIGPCLLAYPNACHSLLPQLFCTTLPKICFEFVECDRFACFNLLKPSLHLVQKDQALDGVFERGILRQILNGFKDLCFRECSGHGGCE